MVYEKVTSIFNTNLSLRNERTIKKPIENLRRPRNAKCFGKQK